MFSGLSDWISGKRKTYKLGPAHRRDYLGTTEERSHPVLHKGLGFRGVDSKLTTSEASLFQEEKCQN